MITINKDLLNVFDPDRDLLVPYIQEVLLPFHRLTVRTRSQFS